MQIKLTFETTEEMEQFCRMITGERVDRPKLQDGGQMPLMGVPVQRDAPAAVPVGQSVSVSVPAASQPTVPVQPAVPSAAPVNTTTAPAGAVPTSEHSYTLDDLSRAAITLLDAGHQQAELQQLLAQFGVAALPMLPESQYGAFATALRGLGAKI